MTTINNYYEIIEKLATIMREHAIDLNSNDFYCYCYYNDENHNLEFDYEEFAGHNSYVDGEGLIPICNIQGYDCATMADYYNDAAEMAEAIGKTVMELKHEMGEAGINSYDFDDEICGNTEDYFNESEVKDYILDKYCNELRENSFAVMIDEENDFREDAENKLNKALNEAFSDGWKSSEE